MSEGSAAGPSRPMAIPEGAPLKESVAGSAPSATSQPSSWGDSNAQPPRHSMSSLRSVARFAQPLSAAPTPGTSAFADLDADPNVTQLDGELPLPGSGFSHCFQVILNSKQQVPVKTLKSTALRVCSTEWGGAHGWLFFCQGITGQCVPVVNSMGSCISRLQCVEHLSSAVTGLTSCGTFKLLGAILFSLACCCCIVRRIHKHKVRSMSFIPPSTVWLSEHGSKATPVNAVRC